MMEGDGAAAARADGNSSARPEPSIEIIHRDLRRAKKTNSLPLRRKLDRLFRFLSMAFCYFAVAVRSRSLYWNALTRSIGCTERYLQTNPRWKGAYGLAEILARPRFTLLSTQPMPPHLLRTPGPAAF